MPDLSRVEGVLQVPAETITILLALIVRDVIGRWPV